MVLHGLHELHACSYEFRVRAMNEVGFSRFHHGCTVVRARTTLPGRPRDVRVWRGAVHAPFSLLVSWRAPATSGGLKLSGYVLHVRAATDAEWRLPSVVELPKPSAAEIGAFGKSGWADAGADTPSDSDSDPDTGTGANGSADPDGSTDGCGDASVATAEAVPDTATVSRVRPERERRVRAHAPLLRSRYVRVTDLEPGVEYAFRVCALSANGASGFGLPHPAHVRTAYTAPDVVPSGCAIAKGGGVLWRWDPPHCTGGLPVFKYCAALRCAGLPPHVDRAAVSDEWTTVDVDHATAVARAAHTVLWEVFCGAVHSVTARHQGTLGNALNFWRMRKLRFVMHAWQSFTHAALRANEMLALAKERGGQHLTTVQARSEHSQRERPSAAPADHPAGESQSSDLQRLDATVSDERCARAAHEALALYGSAPPCDSVGRFVFTPMQSLRPNVLYELACQAQNAEGRSALHTVATFLTPMALPSPPLNFVVECEPSPSRTCWASWAYPADDGGLKVESYRLESKIVARPPPVARWQAGLAPSLGNGASDPSQGVSCEWIPCALTNTAQLLLDSAAARRR
jgi:hypothetical protein